MTSHSSVAYTVAVLSFSLGVVGCAAAYPDTLAGRSCQHDREVCGRASVYTTQQCLDAYEIAAGMFPGCRAQIDAQTACIVASGTAGCDSSSVCTAEREAFTTCRDNGGMGGGI